MDLKSLIRAVPDFPKPGITFRDITPLLGNPAGLRSTIEQMAQQCQTLGLAPEVIAGIESRGFIFGPALAGQLGIGFVPIRKPGKLPAAVHQVSYELEYGQDCLEIHQDALSPGSKVLVVDDLIATGGTAKAAAELLEQAGGTLLAYGFVIELTALAGRAQLPSVPIFSLLEY
ncbi:MAG: adenine phosphoribosyltransferase [Cyanobacteria bacterium P01_H01_bin.15]